MSFSPIAKPQLKLLRILLVEDNMLDARLVSRLLQSASPQNDCRHCTSLAQALEILAKQTVDVILLDLNLDDSSGYETFARVREAAPEAAILVLSASEDEELAVRTVREGAQDYLVKGSFDVKLLLRSIHYACERRASEEALRRSQATARAIFENSLDAIIIFDDNGRLLDANEAAAGLMSAPRGELVRHRLCSLAGDDLQVEIARMRHSESGRGKFWIRRLDGEQRLVDYCFRANILPGRHLGVMRDITEQQSLEEQLRQSQKMEAVGRLAGSVAHDFNNILGVISGYAELIELRARDESIRSKAEKVLSATTKATSLTKQLLAFGRKQVASPKLLNLAQVVSDLSGMMTCLVGAETQLVMLSSRKAGLVFADEGHIEQTLLNLVTNAHESMPGGGTITISVESCDVFRSTPDVPEGSYVKLSVRDTGTGIEPGIRSRIFEPFFTTKTTGSGLGLPTVQGIVKEAGGYLSVQSIPGKGSTFSIYLPKAAETPNVISVAVKQPVREFNGKETILFVDDEAELRDAATEYLQDCGYKLLTAGTVPEALQMAKSCGQEIALLITDLSLPGGSAETLVKEVRQAHPHIEALVISGYANGGNGNGVLQSVAFLQKPFTLQLLGEKVRGLLDAKSRV